MIAKKKEESEFAEVLVRGEDKEDDLDEWLYQEQPKRLKTD